MRIAALSLCLTAALIGGVAVAAPDVGPASSALLAAAPGAIGFEPLRETKLPHEASRVTAADFDGDGRAELLVTNEEVDVKAARLSLLRSDDAGAFQSTLLPQGGEDVAVADLNGDGLLDLVAGDARDAGKLWLYRGLGDGTFAAPVAHPTKARGPDAVAVADLDGDGRLDLAGWNSSRDVSVLHGDGQGGFAEAVRSVDLGQEARGVAAIDLGDDGSADLALLGYEDLLLARNDGAGGFPSADAIGPSRAYPGRVLVADLNLDGRPDLMSTGVREVSIHTGDGRGGLRKLASVPVDPTMSDFAAGDLDGDGRSELIVASQRGGMVVYAADGRSAYREVFRVPTPGGLRGLAIADLDGDCALDVATVGLKSLGVLINTRQSTCRTHGPQPELSPADDFAAPEPEAALLPGGWSFLPPVRTGIGKDTSEAILADLNADGRLDAVVNAGYQRRLLIRLGQADGRFGRQSSIPVPALNQPKPEPCNDSVSIDAETGEVMKGQGRAVSAALGAPRALPMSCLARDDVPSGLAAADLDGDGRMDLVLGTQFGGSVAVLRGDGSGGFAPQQRYSVQSGGVVWGVAVDDLNGDGAPDVVARTGDVPAVLLNDGRGKFGAARTLVVVGEPVLGDVDRDGDVDVVVFRRESDAAGVQVLTNDGRGRFTGAAASPTVPDDADIGGAMSPDGTVLVERPVVDAGTPILADADGDGVLDVLVTAPEERQVLVARGDGRGGFAAPVSLDTGGAYPYEVAVGDLTGDQILDLVVVNNDSNEFAVLAGDGKGGWGRPVSIAVDVGGSGIFLSDLNKDGALDVVTFHRGESKGTLAVHLAAPPG